MQSRKHFPSCEPSCGFPCTRVQQTQKTNSTSLFPSPYTPSTPLDPPLPLSTMVHQHQYFMLNESIPKCPSTDTYPLLVNDLGYPTTTLIFIVYAVTTLAFATIIAFKYNSVKVFNKKIRTQNISNTLWIIYYISMGVRYVKSS